MMDVKSEIENRMKTAIVNMESYREKMKSYPKCQYFLNVFNDIFYQQNMNYYFDDMKTMLAKEETWHFTYSHKKDNKKEGSLLHDKCIIRTKQEKNKDIEIILSLHFLKQKEDYLEASNNLLVFSEKALEYAENINEMNHQNELPSEKTILHFLNKHELYPVIRAIYLTYLPIQNLNEVLKIAVENKIDISSFLMSREKIQEGIEKTLEMNKHSVIPLPVNNIINAIMKNIDEKQENEQLINSFFQQDQLEIILPVNHSISNERKKI